MSTYGAISLQFKAQRITSGFTNVITPASMSSSSRSRISQKLNSPNVEFGSDPLSDPNYLPQDSLISDYSLLTYDIRELQASSSGTKYVSLTNGSSHVLIIHNSSLIFHSSPMVDTSGYCIPNDYPKHLGPDRELQLTGSLEPYVVAEFNNKEDPLLNDAHMKGILRVSKLVDMVQLSSIFTCAVEL